jgi:replicative DNA helicase
VANNALEAEKRFLAYLFSDKSYIAKALARIDRSYLTATKNLYGLIIGFYNKYRGVIDDATLEQQFRKRNLSEDEIIRLQTLVSSAKSMTVTDEANFEAVQEQIIEEYKRRKMLSIAEKVINVNPNICSEDDLIELQNTVQKVLVDINSTDFDVEKEGTVEGDSKDRLAKYKHLKEHPEDANLIKTGFKHIDQSIVGWGYGSENIVCGRKGDGKSVMLLNLGHALWKQGINVIFYSLEIDKEQYERRWDARAALVSSRGLKSGSLTEEEERVFENYINCLEKQEDLFGNKVGSVYIVDCPQNVTPAFIASKTEEIEKKTGVIYNCVIIDYLGIMSSNNPTGVVRDDLGAIALDLKRFAREQKKILITAVQLNRSGKKDMEQKNGHADTDGIAGSDQIADHADNVFVVRSLDEDTALVESSKTRDGSTFSFHIQKNYDKMQMIEIDESEWEAI